MRRQRADAAAGHPQDRRGADARRALSTVATSSSLFTGFMRYLNAPSSTASTAVPMLGAPVTRTTGSVRPRSRSAFSSATPLSPGMSMSLTTTSKVPGATTAMAAAALAHSVTVAPAARRMRAVTRSSNASSSSTSSTRGPPAAWASCAGPAERMASLISIGYLLPPIPGCTTAAVRSTATREPRRSSPALRSLHPQATPHASRRARSGASPFPRAEP